MKVIPEKSRVHTNLISTFLLVLNANEKCFNGDIEGI